MRIHIAAEHKGSKSLAHYYVYKSLVNKYMSLFIHSSQQAVSTEDIYQAGMLALIESARSYRLNSSINFRVYAGRKIKESMQKEFYFQKKWNENKVNDTDSSNDATSIEIHEILSDYNNKLNTDMTSEHADVKHKINTLLTDMTSQLSTKQKQIIYLRYYKNISFKKIGSMFGISESGAWQNHSQILQILQKFYSSGNPAIHKKDCSQHISLE